MHSIKSLRALGLSSSSSLEGVSLALMETDGIDVYKITSQDTIPYDSDLRDKISHISKFDLEDEAHAEEIATVEKELTEFYASLVKEFIKDHEEEINIIGMEGHTLYFNPTRHKIKQIGDGKLLSKLTGLKVVSSFNKADIFAGGQGAPLYPVYHQALCGKLDKPIAIVNIGGVSGLTFLGSNGEVIAFNTGPGNAAINDWVYKKADMNMDYNGKLAITGKIDEKIVAILMRHKFFAQYPPKAVTKSVFKEKLEHLEGLSLEDGTATVTAFIAESIAYSTTFFLPEPVSKIIICGGGALNPTLLRFIRQRMPKTEVISGAELDWSVNTIEAQAFAYLAVRRLFNLPGTFPSTTGALEPIICGDVHEVQ